MAPSSSTTSLTATSTASQSSVNQTHKHVFPFAALILVVLCLAYIVGYLVYRRIMKSWRVQQDANVEVQIPQDFFEKKPRGSPRFTWTRSIRKSKGMSASENLESELSSPFATPAQSDSKKPVISPPPLAIIKDRISCSPAASHPRRDIYTARPKRIAWATRERESRVLSCGRMTEIEADPKLAPVQGPLRPLSILLSRKKERERVSLNLV